MSDYDDDSFDIVTTTPIVDNDNYPANTDAASYANKSFGQAAIDGCISVVSELEAANAEVDRLREELAPKVKRMNAVMASVKEAYAEKKKTLKGYYPQERWADFGVPDKR